MTDSEKYYFLEGLHAAKEAVIGELDCALFEADLSTYDPITALKNAIQLIDDEIEQYTS
jgi:hypothetical protein